jgi:hypothetical protein
MHAFELVFHLTLKQFDPILSPMLMICREMVQCSSILFPMIMVTNAPLLFDLLDNQVYVTLLLYDRTQTRETSGQNKKWIGNLVKQRMNLDRMYSCIPVSDDMVGPGVDAIDPASQRIY